MKSFNIKKYYLFYKLSDCWINSEREIDSLNLSTIFRLKSRMQPFWLQKASLYKRLKFLSLLSFGNLFQNIEVA